MLPSKTVTINGEKTISILTGALRHELVPATKCMCSFNYHNFVVCGKSQSGMLSFAVDGTSVNSAQGFCCFPLHDHLPTCGNRRKIKYAPNLFKNVLYFEVSRNVYRCMITSQPVPTEETLNMRLTISKMFYTSKYHGTLLGSFAVTHHSATKKCMLRY